MTIVRVVLFKGFVGYLIVTLLVYLAPMPPAFANPVLQTPVPNGGSNVASAGAATITTKANTETITQTTGNAVIDWSSFNIGGKETTKFVDPSSSSLTVNRVHDNDPSKILGTLTSNGNIVLINPNGVFFGKGSKVDVNGIVATTSDVSNANVMAGGKLHFTASGNPNATVENQGSITAKDAGLVGLVAPNVINSGVISAKLGKVQLSSGDEFTLDFYGDKLMEIAVTDPNLTNQLVENSGNIEADGGQVKITAAAARGIINSLITVSGKIDAPAFQQKNGEILIYAEGSNAVKGNIAANKGTKKGASTVQVSGILDASGKTAGQKGGNISILGDDIAIQGGSYIDASGALTGGNIKIGGDFHGGGATPTASATVVQNNVTINANALDNGNGGDVAVWSDTRTEFLGLITAKGGPSGGDGGFVETSGHQLLSLTDGNGHTGKVDASAPRGAAGTWLLDPYDVVIGDTDAGDENNDGGTPLTTITPGSNNVSETSNISHTTIETALNAGTNVLITTGGNASPGTDNGDITVNSALTASGTGSLTLSAYRNILVNAGITLQGGALTLNSDNGGNGSGYIYVGANITTNGGNITFGGGTSPTTMAAIGNAGNVVGITLYGATLNAGSGGNISLIGQGYIGAGSSSYGVSVYNSTVETTGIGTAYVKGTGGGVNNGSFDSNDYGVLIQGNWPNYSSVSTTGGALTIIGVGGTAGVHSSSNYGVFINNGGASTTTGVLTIDATAGEGYLSGQGQGLLSNTGNITSTTGAINISAAGVAAGHDIELDLGSQVYSAGSTGGAITLTGTTGGGIYLQSNPGDKIGNGSTTGNIVLITDALSINNNITTGGSVVFKPYTSDTAVSVGSGTNGSGLYLSDAELGDITAGSLTIGDNVNTAAMDINTAHTFASPTTFTTNGANITLDSNVVSNVSSANALTFSGPVVNNANNTVSSGNGNIIFGSTIDGANALTVNAGMGTTTFTGAVGGGTPLASLNVSGSGGITVDNNITTNNGNINLNGPVTLGGNSVINAGSGTLTTGSTIDGNFNLNATAASLSLGGAIGGGTPLNNVSLTSTNAVTLPAINASTVNVQATGASGDITLGGNIATSGGGNDIVLAANRNFLNSGNYTLTPTGRWIIYSTQASGDTKGGLSEAQDIYSQTYGSESPGSVPNPGQKTWVYSSAPPVTPENITLTATSQTVTYGTAGGGVGNVAVTYSCTAGACGDISSLSGGTITVSGTLNSTNSYYTANTAHTITLTPGSITVNWNPGYSTGVITYGTGLLTVNQATLTVTAAATGATSKVYDGTTTTAGVNLSGNQIAGDVVNITDTTVNFSDKNVGNGKTVTAAGISISGADAANYTLGNNAATTTANITARSITVTAATNTKTYDSTTAAAATPIITSGSIVAGDTANFSETYDTSAVGTGKILTPSGIVTDGNGGSNYTYTFANNLTGEIDAIASGGSGNNGRVVSPAPGATPPASNNPNPNTFSVGQSSSSGGGGGNSAGSDIANLLNAVESSLWRVIPNPIATNEPVKISSPDPTDYVTSQYDIYQLSQIVTKPTNHSKPQDKGYQAHDDAKAVTRNGLTSDQTNPVYDRYQENTPAMVYDPANDNDSDSLGANKEPPITTFREAPSAWLNQATKPRAGAYQVASAGDVLTVMHEEENTAPAEYDSANDNPDNIVDPAGNDNNPADNAKDKKKVRQSRLRERLQQRLTRGMRSMRGGQQFGRLGSRIDNA